MDIFQKEGFIRKIEPYHLRMKHYIIQLTATAGHEPDLQIDPQTAMNALHFCQFFFVNFLQFG